METLFFHGKTTDGRRFTIAGKFTQRGLIIKDDILILGASLCSKNDCFVKKVGRYKAEGRLGSKLAKGKMTIPVPKECLDNTIKAFIDNATMYNNVDSIKFQKQFNLYHG